MLSEQTAPQLDRHSRWLADTRQLEEVAHELRGRYLIDAHLVPDQATPYVRVSVPGTGGDRVSVTSGDDRRFLLGATGVTHPLFDPTGAARRIATRLRRA